MAANHDAFVNETMILQGFYFSHAHSRINSLDEYLIR